MLRQAVAKSEMDCHSSSVESAVSDRTETKTPGAQTDQYKYRIYVYTVYCHCLNQGASFLECIILIIIHVKCKNKVNCILFQELCVNHWGVLLF